MGLSGVGNALFLSVIALGALQTGNAQQVVVVNTQVGQIAGQSMPVTLPDGYQTTIAEFRGIPYAEPPVGNLRFAKPVPKTSLGQRFDAFTFGAQCPQPSGFHPGPAAVSSEDCLFLNVFAPSAAVFPAQNAQSRLPVLVWIHPGGFNSGTADRNVSTLVVFGNIIIVSINYRLGALGFLSTDDQVAPGNFGLWDQRLALQWVQANIAAFGGDPDQITIGGVSAGSFSATYQALYPPNQGLFKRFIAGSGTAISDIGSRQNVSIYAKLLAGKLNCSTASSLQMVSCLRTKSVDAILNAPVDVERPFDLAFAPSVDGDFVRLAPDDQVKWPPGQTDLSSLRSVDAMFCTTSAEGDVTFMLWVTGMAQQMNQSVSQGVSEELFDNVIRNLLIAKRLNPDQALVDAIKYEYRDWQDPFSPAAVGQSTLDLLTDRQWFIPNVVFSRNHDANNTRTNTYLFQYDESQSQGSFGIPWEKGAGHIAYWGLAFGNGQDSPGVPLNLSLPTDSKLWGVSKVIMTYWSNFIKTGNPNSPTSVSQQWPDYNLQDESYLYVSPDITYASTRCKAKRTAFWLDYLPKVKAATSSNVDYSSGNSYTSTPANYGSNPGSNYGSNHGSSYGSKPSKGGRQQPLETNSFYDHFGVRRPQQQQQQARFGSNLFGGRSRRGYN